MNQTQTLPIRDAFREGWKQTRDNARAFVTLGLINLLLAVALQSALAPEAGRAPRPLLGLTLQLLQFCTCLIYMRFALALRDGRELQALVDQRVLRGFLPFLATGMLYGLTVGAGLLLLVFPGVVWGLRYAYSTMLVVDHDLDPLAAFHESARLTEGVKGQLLGFIALCVLLNALGASVMGLGLIVTVPVTFGAHAYVLRHLQKVAGAADVPPSPAPAAATHA